MSDTAPAQPPPQPQTSLDEIREQRLEKSALFEQAGMAPYGQRVDDLTATAEAKTRFAAAGQDEIVTVRVAGRVIAKRIMGKSSFFQLRDQSGPLQVYAQKNVLGEDLYTLFKKLDIGDIIFVEGELFATRTGETTVRAARFELLSKSLRPLPEKWHGLTDVEQRYRQRYLDLISNEEVRTVFERRVQIVRGIRNFLDTRGFMEVETPMLQPIPGGAAAKPFETHYHALDCPMFLRIAPELYLKRLLVGGFERVYEINRNFRNEGLSRRHNPEFTMVEIYQAYGDCRSMMALVEDMVTTVAQDVLGTLDIRNDRGETIHLARPWRRATYAELVCEKMGDDWFERTRHDKADAATELGLSVPPEASDLEITHEIYEKVIEKTLVQPTFVTRLPRELVPLAKRCEDDSSVVDVFELEIDGQEIAPGYSELNNPIEQRERFLDQVDGPAEVAAAAGVLDEDFLTAMEHGMPPAGGMGIGIDRLVMLLLGQASIRDVILFPQLRRSDG